MQREARSAQSFGFSDEVADYARSLIQMITLPPQQGGAGLSVEESAVALTDLLQALVKLEGRGTPS
jgi:hypothetical protein